MAARVFCAAASNSPSHRSSLSSHAIGSPKPLITSGDGTVPKRTPSVAGGSNGGASLTFFFFTVLSYHFS